MTSTTTEPELTCDLGTWAEPALPSDGTPWWRVVGASRQRIAALQRQADGTADTTTRHRHDVGACSHRRRRATSTTFGRVR